MKFGFLKRVPNLRSEHSIWLAHLLDGCDELDRIRSDVLAAGEDKVVV